MAVGDSKRKIDAESAAAQPDSSTVHSPGPVDLPAQVRLPEQFGPYRIVQMLGQGNMGTVYLAQDTRLARSVALKVPRFPPHLRPQTLERFYREARAAAGLRHANICPVYEVGEIDGIQYLTMAFIEGESLAQRLRSQGPMKQRQAAELVRVLALALAEAHGQNVVHRDLKPANIMIDHRGEPVIMDFGLARRTDEGGIRLTQEGALLGTPAYMSPEQVEGNIEAQGPACDIYSLGVILYELLTGKLPFQGSVGSVLAQIVTQEPRPPSFHRPGLHPTLDAICRKAMAKHPQDRFASMNDFAEALRELPSTLPGRSREKAGSGPVAKKGRGWFYGVALILLLAGLGLSAVLMIGGLVYVVPSLGDVLTVGAPGASSIELSKKGSYTVFYQHDQYAKNPAAAIANVQLRIFDEKTGKEVLLVSPESTTDYLYQGNLALLPMKDFSIDRPGTYQIHANYATGLEGPPLTLCVGHEVHAKYTRGGLLIISSLLVCFGTPVVALIPALLAFLLRMRDKPS